MKNIVLKLRYICGPSVSLDISCVKQKRRWKGYYWNRKIDISSNNSPTSSIFSMEQSHFSLGEFGMEGQLMDNNMLFVADYQSTYMTLWDD
ncbi:hypothetical protein H5410_014167 [Solanum commersonii]|uniref:Uncharacterized protein n=1 Tax=Solanum commersonii TaxID=4109 RepID=A0A9J5ZQM7_SOLCO|nr:hypothetical protein H5410_014167 [Solanum commersonii]